MQHREIEPPLALREVIKCLWYDCIPASEPATSFEVVPDGYAEIIFYFGSALHVVTPEGLQPLPSPFLVGLLNQPVHFHAPQQLEIIGIRCFPWTVFDFLGLPAAADGVRVMPHPLAQLQAGLSELVEAGNVAGALAALAQHLELAPQPPAADGVLGKAGTAMRAAHGTLPVREVAAAAHATVRTLERRFKQAAGHTVKDVSGLMRFEAARNHLWQHPGANLAGLAQELGYADQAHLSREFRRYSGTTPAAFARKAKSRQRAMGPDFVAFIQA